MTGASLRPLSLADTESSIVERLDAIVAVRPDDRVANVGDANLTWTELHQRSNALALRLHSELGPGQEPVAIIAVSGIDMIVAPLGVLKSGRPYTFVDASMPLAHVLQIVSLSEIRSAIIGTPSAELKDALSLAGLSLHQVGLDRSEDRPIISIGSTDPANIVFTSGSTGIPKGVIVPHRYHLFHAATCAERGFRPDDHVGLVLPMSFAWGAEVFWRTLLLGATIFPYDPREHGIASLVSWCSEQQIGVLEATTSLFRAVVRGTTEVLSTLRIVESGGEPLFARDAAEISLRLPSTCAFHNKIGSSETGAYAFFDIPPLAEGLEGIVPAGTGVPHKEITICDAQGNAILSGETGDIIVTSSFGANGYWRQRDLTESQFVTLPDGRTSYRTGDLGRWLPNGALLHLGRSDGMMKIHGYLVEPAEVEAALLDTGLVHEAAAFGVVGNDGLPSLHAYVVPIDGLRSSNAAIRRALRERVPEYLVPAALVATSELPKNDNDKIDRAQLKPIAETKMVFTPPRDEWEREVAREWCTILGLDQVSVDDDFFGCGGDSLGVLELITAMADDHDVTVRSSDLVECPTLGLFAARARKSEVVPDGVLVPLVVNGDGPPLFCFAGGGGLAGDFLLLARYLDLNRPVYGLQARGIEGGGLPDWTVQRWAARCVRQMRKCQPHGPYYLGGHSFGGVIAMEAAHQLQLAGEEVALVVFIDTLAPGGTSVDSRMLRYQGSRSGNVVAAYMLEAVRRMRRILGDFVKINAAGIWEKQQGQEKALLFYRHARFLFLRYHPEPLKCPAVVYWAEGTNDERFDFDSFLQGPWEQHTRPGNHLTILGEPNVESLAKHLRIRLEQPSVVGNQSADA